MRLLGQFQTFYFYFFHDKTLYAQKAQKGIQGTKRHFLTFYFFFHDKILHAQRGQKRLQCTKRQKKHKNATKQKFKMQISEQK